MFMQNEEICMTIKNTIKTLNNSKEDTKYNRIKLLIAYATALITYENCQRSGVVTNLTIEEFENRQRADNGMTVISCLNHKTGPQGRAQLVVSESTEHFHSGLLLVTDEFMYICQIVSPVR